MGRCSPRWTMPSTFGSLQNNHVMSFGMWNHRGGGGWVFLHVLHTNLVGVDQIGLEFKPVAVV